MLQYGNLVESIARRFSGAGEPVEDLVQEGYIGLITAVDLYNAGKGVKFSTYATHFVIGQIKHYLRDKGKIIKEPAWLQELNQRMGRVIESLSHKFGRQPTEQEISEVMDMSEEAVRELLTTREVFKVSSLDGDRDESSTFPADTDKIKNQKCVTFELPVEDKIVLSASMDRLKEIEQAVIHYFFYLDLNQTEIAKKMGISCNYVSHILRNSTKKLKKILVTEEIRDAQIQLQQKESRVTRGAEIDQAAVLDPTTGLYSRRYFIDRLEEEFSRGVRYSHPVSVVFLKLAFKNSSVSGAWSRTEDILVKTADTIRGSVRKMDVPARYGEDVFAVILPHTGSQVSVTCKRLRNKIDQMLAEYCRSRPDFSIDVKSAFAAYPDDAKTGTELIARVSRELNILTDEDETLPKAA